MAKMSMLERESLQFFLDPKCPSIALLASEWDLFETPLINPNLETFFRKQMQTRGVTMKESKFIYVGKSENRDCHEIFVRIHPRLPAAICHFYANKFDEVQFGILDHIDRKDGDSDEETLRNALVRLQRRVIRMMGAILNTPFPNGTLTHQVISASMALASDEADPCKMKIFATHEGDPTQVSITLEGYDSSSVWEPALGGDGGTSIAVAINCALEQNTQIPCLPFGVLLKGPHALVTPEARAVADTLIKDALASIGFEA